MSHLALLALLMLYVVAASAVWNPHVTETYRRYYIDRALQYWPGDPRFEYRYGIRLAMPANEIFLQRGPWVARDGAGMWMIENRADVFLVPTSTSTGPAELALLAEAYTSERVPTTTVSISINGAAIGDVQFQRGTGVRPIRLPIPAALLDAKTLATIGFEVLDHRAAGRRGFSKRRRMLGLHLLALCVGDRHAGCRDR